LIGSTGMPGVTFVPFGTPNADGTLNLYGGSLFGANGNLFATFDTGALDPNTGVITPIIPDTLYQINTSTGQATAIGSTDFSLDAFVNVNGTTVAFKNLTGELESLDLSTGGATTIGTFDQSSGLVFGAAAAPEPSGIALAVIGIAAAGLWRKRRGARRADRSV
jgi:hypothetical protein